MVPEMAAALWSQLPPTPWGKLSHTQEKRKVTEKKKKTKNKNKKPTHYSESRAVKIKLREALGLIQLFPSWLHPRAGVIKDLILTWLLWTQPPAGYA
jgi:hypothetical protein